MPISRDSTAQKVLDVHQQGLSPLLEEFSATHILAGGTAISLQLGHRKSIDFDLFCFGPQGTGIKLMNRIKKSGCMFELETAPRFWYSEEEIDELTLLFDGVKVQFIDFSRNPFDVPVKMNSEVMLSGSLPGFSLLQLGALKVYAMMYRKKFKDLVDIYFILQHTEHSLGDLIAKAKEIFTSLYKEEYTFESLFDTERDMTETVDYLIENPPSFEQIQSFLRLETDTLLLSR